MTYNLTGTKEDAADLEQFFCGELGFEIKKYNNLSRVGFLKALEESSKYVQNSKETYNCVFVVAMSHGSEVRSC